jgi:hypothetical protein
LATFTSVKRIIVFKLVVTSGFLVFALASLPALAQTAAPPTDEAPVAAPPSTAAPPSAVPMGGTSSVEDLKAGCRTEAKSQGLKGPALQKAVINCVGAQQTKVAARMTCRQQGMKNGLKSGPELKQFVKTCMSMPKP